MPELNPLKEKFRKKYKAIRDGLSASSRTATGRRIAGKLFNMPQWREAKTVAIYMSRGSEVGTREILKKAVAQGKTVAIPKVRGGNLAFFRVRGLRDCAKGAFGIQEPKSGRPKAGKLDLVLVPGIAFDRSGHRLGYGLGFYDRFLSKNPAIFSAGLTYQKTLAARVPHGRRDAPVCCVISEKGIMGANGRI